MKKLVSFMLSVCLITGVFCGALPVYAADSAKGAESALANWIIDYSDSSVDISGYTSDLTGTGEGATKTTFTKSESGYLDIITNGGTQKATHYPAIPLGDKAIDTSAGPFSISVTAKLYNDNSAVVRNFFSLGDGNNNSLNFGFGWCSNVKFQNHKDYKGQLGLMLNANNRSDGMWTYKAAQKVENDGEDAKTYRTDNNVNIETYDDMYFLGLEEASKNFYTYRWDIDPRTKTFRFYFKKEGDTDWTEPYAKFNMINPYADKIGDEYVRFEEKGVFPTGDLPETISVLKYQQRTAENVETEIQIKNISYVSGCDYTADLTNLSASSASSGTGTVSKESDIITWTASGNEKGYDYKLRADFDDFILTEKPVEIEFSAKFPDGKFRVDGFPILLGEDGTPYYFGFETATLNGSNSYSLQQMLFRQLGFNKIAKFDGTPLCVTDPDKVYDAEKRGVNNTSNTQNPNQTDKTQLESSKKLDGVTVGLNGAASVDFYDFKFVIDPVAMEYRYYQRKNGETAWNEIYDGCPGYPVQIDRLPKSLSALEFRVCNNSDTGDVKVQFKNISVRTAESGKTEGINGRIVNRVYTYEGETVPTSAVASTKAKVTAKITNYSSSASNAKALLAVYDKEGNLVFAQVAQDTLNSGINEVNFENIPASQAVWKDYSSVDTNKQNTSKGVYTDENVYKLFVWDVDGSLKPFVTTEVL